MILDTRTERKKEETKQKIINTAVRLFQQQGFDATTMEQIASEVDIAKGTLYNYFPVKEAILSEFMNRVSRERNPQRLEQLQALPDTRARMVFLLTDLVAAVQAQKELFERYFAYRLQHILSLGKSDPNRHGIGQLETEIILLGQQSGEIRQDVPVDLLVDHVDFIFIEVARLFFIAPETFNASQEIDRCVDLFLNGVRRAGD